MNLNLFQNFNFPPTEKGTIATKFPCSHVEEKYNKCRVQCAKSTKPPISHVHWDHISPFSWPRSKPLKKIIITNLNLFPRTQQTRNKTVKPQAQTQNTNLSPL